MDVSTFQVPVDDSYSRDWFIFRVAFDGNIDKNAAHNLAWAIKARADGRLKNFTGYVVPLSGYDSNQRCLDALDRLGFPADAVVNIDGEKWDGTSYQINGDHSDQWNALAEAARKRQGGRSDLVWAYGNRGPDLVVWPNKPDWIGWKVAAYTSADQPNPPLPSNCISWQYTNGMSIYDNPNRPHSSPPFGRCDHDIIFNPPLPGDQDVPLSDADITRIKTAVIDSDGETVASALRRLDNIAGTLSGLKSAVSDLTAAVAKLQVAPVDPVVLARQLANHLDIQVGGK